MKNAKGKSEKNNVFSMNNLFLWKEKWENMWSDDELF